MRTTRRSLLRATLRTITTAMSLAGGLLAAQFLLQRRKPRPLYPSRTLPYAAKEGAGIIRPPGAVDERSFLGACIRCYRCQDVCDPGAIRFFTEEDGKYCHTPYVDPSRAACTLCMKCTQVCPSGALLPMGKKERAAVRMGSVALNTDSCLSYKAKRIRYSHSLLRDLGRPHTEIVAEDERRGFCGECYMVCPRRGKAIRYEPGAFLTPVVFTRECVGCGLCEEICRVVLRGEPAIRVVPTRCMV